MSQLIEAIMEAIGGGAKATESPRTSAACLTNLDAGIGQGSGGVRSRRLDDAALLEASRTMVQRIIENART
jgi:hypothetical protein